MQIQIPEINIKEKLNPKQVIFAQWLVMPDSQRSPKEQQQLAEQLGVVPSTLSEWKHLPEIRYYMDELLGIQGRELVPKAIKKLEESLDSSNAKVAFEAARDILNRWGQITRYGTIVTSLKDLYEHFSKRT